MVVKPCPRCKRMIPQGLPYCPDCAPLAAAELEQIRERNTRKKAHAYNSRRDPKYLTFYRSKDWKAQSRAKLRACGYRCEARLAGCQGLAVEVHHIKPIQTPEGWDKRLEWENLEAVCVSCHNGRHPEKFRKANDGGVIDLRTVKQQDDQPPGVDEKVLNTLGDNGHRGLRRSKNSLNRMKGGRATWRDPDSL